MAAFTCDHPRRCRQPLAAPPAQRGGRSGRRLPPLVWSGGAAAQVGCAAPHASAASSVDLWPRAGPGASSFHWAHWPRSQARKPSQFVSNRGHVGNHGWLRAVVSTTTQSLSPFNVRSRPSIRHEAELVAGNATADGWEASAARRLLAHSQGALRGELPASLPAVRCGPRLAGAGPPAAPLSRGLDRSPLRGTSRRCPGHPGCDGRCGGGGACTGVASLPPPFRCWHCRRPACLPILDSRTLLVPIRPALVTGAALVATTRTARLVPSACIAVIVAHSLPPASSALSQA